MNQRSLSIIVLSLLLATATCQQQLLFVQEMFRHGARGPFSDYWDGEDQMYIQGELTPTGARQHYVLGTKLREEYILQRQFLSAEYNHTEIYVRSTDTNRTISSANSQLLGLYPQAFQQIPSNVSNKYRVPPFSGVSDATDLQNNPLPFGIGIVPVHVVEEIHDVELQPWDFCDDYTNQVQIFKNNHANYTQQFNQNFSSLFEKVSIAVNSNITSYEEIGGVWGGVFEVFISDMFNGRALPDSLSEQDINDLDFVNSFSWYYGDFGTDLGTKQLVTPFLNLLINGFDAKLSGQTPDLKWIMYSAHDSNVALAIRALNISNYECLIERRFSVNSDSQYLNCEKAPDFASSLIWELYLNEMNATVIKLRYEGRYMNLCEQRNTECLYSEFRQRVLDYVLPDFQAACQVNQQQESLSSSAILVQAQGAGKSVTVEDQLMEESNPLMKYIIIQGIIIAAITGFSAYLYLRNRKLLETVETIQNQERLYSKMIEISQ